MELDPALSLAILKAQRSIEGHLNKVFKESGRTVDAGRSWQTINSYMQLGSMERATYQHFLLCNTKYITTVNKGFTVVMPITNRQFVDQSIS
ncbi:hypothetical protein EB796_000987 [Bugula neritina]|uniref:Uncharacterized protein n=1 Tax=Bugula neritina TaxID=10212 RepID=A0A7J7KRI0_BUGNE|nr:hypothetical protein EB796_000987 [Bugula neritina]